MFTNSYTWNNIHIISYTTKRFILYTVNNIKHVTESILKQAHTALISGALQAQHTTSILDKTQPINVRLNLSHNYNNRCCVLKLMFNSDAETLLMQIAQVGAPFFSFPLLTPTRVSDILDTHLDTHLGQNGYLH